jgi:agmatine deiminase
MQTMRFVDGTVLDGKSPIKVVLAASYVNFLITNGVVLIPKYFKEGRSNLYLKTDETALKIFQELYPERKIIQIDVENGLLYRNF